MEEEVVPKHFKNSIMLILVLSSVLYLFTGPTVQEEIYTSTESVEVQGETYTLNEPVDTQIDPIE